MRPTYTADLTKEGRFWHIHVRELDAVTQARFVGEIEHMARDLVVCLLDVNPNSFDLEIPGMPEPGPTEHLLEQLAAAGRRLEAADAERDAAIADVTAAVSAAQGAVPIKTMADLANVTRPTVYRLLETDPG